MPDLQKTETASGDNPTNDANAPTGAGINTPELSDKTLKPKRRAITDSAHIGLILSNLQNARRAQNEKNGRIAAKINAERPYVDATLESEGLGYKSNFSTKPLSVTLSKVGSRLVKAVQSARYLTAAQLPDTIVSGKSKTELFRSEITGLIRRWDGWFDWLNQIASEDSTYGWCVGAWLDEQSWKPRAYRQDEIFMPDGTPNSVDGTQVILLRRFFQMHELADMIADRDAADTAGWDIEATVEAINNAKAPGIPGANNAPYTDARRYEDAIRESSVSLTLVNGAKQIEVYDCLATEIDGKISHYIIVADTKKLIFQKLDRFEKARDCLSFFSYEQGNGKIMGSKGVGREIYEIASALDRARCETIDRLQMAGKIIITGPENMIDRFKLSVIGNVAIIPDGFQISQTKIEPATDEFMQLDQLLQGLLDQIAGSVSPKQLPGERVTAAQVNLFAEREEEKRDDRDTRFIMQLACGVIWTMTRRAMSDECTDEDAKAVRDNLLASMSPEELEMLIKQPALNTIEDFTDMDAQKIVVFAQEHKGDGRFDQHKLAVQSASALISAEFAQDVVLPENDPTVTAENTRFAELENILLGNGTLIDVSPRDNHNDHIVVHKTKVAAMVPAAVKGDLQALQIIPVFLQHWSDHLSAAEAAGVDKKSLAPSQKELQGIAQQIGQLQAHAEAVMQAQKTGQPIPPPTAPAQPPRDPLAAPDQGQPPAPPDAAAGQPPPQ